MPILETIEGIWYRKDPGWIGVLIRVLLTPVSFAYQLYMTSRRYRFLLNPKQSQKPAVPVICIGNLTVGGSGKTPTVALIVRLCKSMGKHPAVISRGYKGEMEGRVALVSDGKKLLLTAAQAGDEPVMLAATFPDTPVVIGAKRVDAAKYALEKLEIDCLILDDAFQHLAIGRDLDVLCVNGELGFGNGRTLPAGPLRESLTAAKNAGLCIINHYGPPLEGIEQTLEQCGFSGPTIFAHHRLIALRNIKTGQEIALEKLAGKSVLAFAGIAHPNPFFKALKNAGIQVEISQSFPDHFSYQIGDLNSLTRLAKAASFEYYVTTEKDAVKLMDLGQDLPVEIWAAVSRPDLSEDDKRRIINVLKEVV